MRIRKKKRITLAVTYTLTAMLVLGGFVYTAHRTADFYRLSVENSYQRAFAEMVTSVGEMDSALEKSLYATSPQMVSAVCTQVYGKALAAQMAMSELPFSNVNLEHTAGFITKVGDYAFMLSKNAAGGHTYTDEQYRNLTALSESAGLLAANLNGLLSDLNAGTLTISDLNDSQDQLSESEEALVPANLVESFKQMESEFPEIPSLIYDGPFSEHITQMKPKYLEGKNSVSARDALASAAEFMNLKESVFSLENQREGTLPVYVFGARVDGGELTVEVTVQGGVVSCIRNDRDVAKSVIPQKDAVKLAEKFLSEHGYNAMRVSYWHVAENAVTVNFAYVQDDAICYSDLIKVTVALDSGRVVGFENTGYLMSHSKRDIPEAKISEEDAADCVTEGLTVLSHNMAVIPTDGKNEMFCHEFICKNAADKHYILYVNAETGVEEKILILLEDENGTLTL